MLKARIRSIDMMAPILNEDRYKMATFVWEQSVNRYYKKMREKFPGKIIMNLCYARCHLINAGLTGQSWLFMMPPKELTYPQSLAWQPQQLP